MAAWVGQGSCRKELISHLAENAVDKEFGGTKGGVLLLLYVTLGYSLGAQLLKGCALKDHLVVVEAGPRWVPRSNQCVGIASQKESTRLEITGRDGKSATMRNGWGSQRGIIS